ncbi:hypothetical protein WDV06_26410 [Streptomyces racemochromogenes]|uniref:HTH cro/C1-type domain-containing protein n=1 Tax=Streptomyces racemochromogenes TaxID=67353 RepID=A0ABW7PJL9_9ACTN
MARAGRPQGAPKGRSRAANELAELLRQVTTGLTVRDLAQRFGGGKTAWSEYRSGARIIPLGRLGLVVGECVRDPRSRQRLLAKARTLHAQALTADAEAEAEATPAPGLEEALRRAQEDLATSGRLVEGLLSLMAMLRDQAKVAEPDDAPDATSAPGPHASPPERLRGRLDEALDQLVTARAAEEAARRAVSEVRARHEAAARRGLPALAPPPSDAPGTDPGEEPEEEPPPTADKPLSTELIRLRHSLEQQREDATWLWERTRADRGAHEFVEGVVLERLDTLPAVPAAPSVPALRPTGPARAPTAVPGALLALVVIAAATLTGVLVSHRHTFLTAETPHVQPLPPHRASPSAPPATPSPAPPPSPSSTPAPLPSFPGPLPAPGTPAPPAPDAPAPTPQSPPGTAYAVSQDRRSVLRWTARDGSWKVIGPAAEKVYAGAAGLFATHTGDGRIFKYDEPSSSWSQIGFPGDQFATAGDALYGITEHRDAVMRWTGQGTEWVRIGTAAARLYAGGAGLFATSPDTGALFRYTGFGDDWVDAGGPGADFAVGPDYVARISPDGREVWQADAKGSNWRRIGGPARNLYAGGAGLFAVDTATGRILRYDHVPDVWTPIGTAGVGLAVGADSVYRIGADLAVSRWTGRGAEWTTLGISASSLATPG